MPYFKNNNINLLFIHIPKTGGNSFELYLSNKYDIPLNNNALYDFIENNDNINVNSSLQHLVYKDIMKYKDYFKIDLNNLMIISIVRNPYNRIISDLFWLKKINVNTSKEEVYNIIQKYLHEECDNHNIPQYLFITDDKKQLINNLILLRTETLNQDITNLGYEDFNIKVNDNKNIVDYDNYLNNNSIKLINNFYHYDFLLFNYKKRVVN